MEEQTMSGIWTSRTDDAKTKAELWGHSRRVGKSLVKRSKPVAEGAQLGHSPRPQNCVLR